MVVKTKQAPPEGGEAASVPELPEGDGAQNGGLATRTYTRVKLEDVPLESLTAERVPEDEWVSHPLHVQAVRSPGQVKVDETVKALHEDWLAAGSPAERQSPRGRFTVAPEHAASIRAMLARAGTYLDVHVKIGPPVHDQDGNERVVFTARDRVRKPRTKPDVNANADGTPDPGENPAE
jgi:hypothetical protein